MNEVKIAICGTAPSTIRLAPYNDTSWQIWGCSPGLFGVATRTDAWFELHRYEPGQPWFSPEYCQFLERHPNLWIGGEDGRLPNGRVIPYQDLVAKYSPYFFTSSIAWMMAMAIEAGATKIGLWGVDMAATEEYGYQRAGCQYMALLARAKGIEVGVPPESDLMRPALLYGVSEYSHAMIKTTARSRELAERLRQSKAELNAREKEVHFLEGAIDDLQWNRQTWFGNVDTLGQQFCEPTEAPALTELLQAPEQLLDVSISHQPAEHPVAGKERNNGKGTEYEDPLNATP